MENINSNEVTIVSRQYHTTEHVAVNKKKKLSINDKLRKILNFLYRQCMQELRKIHE